MRIKSALSIVLILTSLSVLVSGVLTMINGDVDHSVLGGDGVNHCRCIFDHDSYWRKHSTAAWKGPAIAGKYSLHCFSRCCIVGENSRRALLGVYWNYFRNWTIPCG